MTELPLPAAADEHTTDTDPYEGTVERRNTWLDAIADHINQQRVSQGKKPLPPITVKNRETNGYLRPFSFVLHDPDKDDRYIGYLTLRPPANDGMAQELAVHIDEQYRHHQGYGIAIYLEAMKRLPEGVGMTSDNHLSEDAYGMWRTLEAAGVVTSNRPPEEVSPVQIDDLITYKSVRFRTVFGGRPQAGPTQTHSIAEPPLRPEQS